MNKLGNHVSTLHSNKQFILLNFFIDFSLSTLCLLLTYFLLYSGDTLNLSTVAWAFSIFLILIGIFSFTFGIWYISHIRNTVELYEAGLIFHNTIYLYENLGPINWKKDYYKILGKFKLKHSFMYITNKKELEDISDMWFKNAHIEFVAAYQNHYTKATLLIRNE